MKFLRTSIFLLAAFLYTAPANAQDITVGAQVRPRFESRDPFNTPAVVDNDVFTSMRVRGQVRAELENNVRVMVQFQDVRLWGEETNTLTDFQADNFDVHQAYVEVSSEGPTTYSARLGRQEMPFGGHRLMGNVNWTQQARSFDAARLSADGSDVRLDVIGAWLSDATAATNDNDAYLVGAYAQLREAGPGTLDVYALFNTQFDRSGAGDPDTEQGTFGARWWGQSGNVSFRTEASYQTGNRAGLDVSAFMFGGRVGTTLADGAGSVTFWYDYLSGDDDPTDNDIKVFDTLFATNHKFYGLADLFLNIPVHTAGRGLQDIAVKGSYRPDPRVNLGLDIHSFHVAKSQGLSTGHLGEEADVTVTYQHSGNMRVTAGLSQIVQADGFADIGRLAENMTWVYLMMDVGF
jgi:hypothetical protein